MAVSLLTLTIFSQVISFAPPPCRVDCITTSTGICRVFLGNNPFYVPCVQSRDEWGNNDECVHPHYIPLYLC